ncbi:collagen alpha-2(VIII) chain-like [Ruditapes philippinarum]|uniref:collagen alpha-2(VIII) chain-like n=1 Tax=Ruditapes philippinarum TaxID=129788 RepID=UPI00295B0FC5|nr:collagen alpha-2(VIII) chain-like [Ruditapes philippinarum]
MEKGKKMLTELSENLKKPSVAFFAHNVVDLKLDRTDKIIIFTTATTNEGSGYDTSTGIFTAPVGGLYQFVVNYCAYYKQHSPLALVLSGNVIARSSNYDANYYTCSSFYAVIRVKSSEKIWVKCLSGSSGYALYKGGWFMNSFSGILINK